MSSRGGKLLYFGSLVLLIGAFNRMLDASTLTSRIWYTAIVAILAIFGVVRLGAAGVFDTDDGVVIKRIWRTKITVARSANPVADFEPQAVVGHRLIIRADGHPPIPTDFVFAQPRIEPLMELPSNLGLATASARTR